MLEVVDLIGATAGRRPRYDFAEARYGEANDYVSDIEKVRRDLGWEPKVGFDRGLRELVAWAEAVK